MAGRAGVATKSIRDYCSIRGHFLASKRARLNLPGCFVFNCRTRLRHACGKVAHACKITVMVWSTTSSLNIESVWTFWPCTVSTVIITCAIIQVESGVVTR
ncbi:hypothetical protein VFPPC_17957 [Pochonia chlamydosporia 170]|uniref:Uncharacterized protein n=1 Tax=Pochonia chlamydosporia 170 TaxID=1380566 RepID=A0A219APW6_METCM|nr:hypothetical protein VFPPC_17957 [Pochonia chlamydosporia 170]OWT42850.1 hypothetical protein VFPPC_17957 [Pochonia chlamydosporia 170]